MRIYIDPFAYVKCYSKTDFEKGAPQVQTIIDEAKDREHVLSSSY